jgi:AraC-like DNA-binding protein
MYEAVKYIHGGKFMSRGQWKHPERVIDSTEIIIATKGTFYIQVGDVEYVVSPGDVLRLDSGVRHYGSRFSTSEVCFYWVHFVGAEQDELPPHCFHPESVAQAELITRQLLHYANTDGYPRQATECLLKVLLMELNAENLRSGAVNHRLYSTVKEWVRVNCDLPIKVSDVAAQFNYNEDYLNRVFRQFHPKGLKSYIDEMKMQRIKNDLVNEAMSLSELAEKYGFGDYKYFLKYFKYHEGISPTKYRQIYFNVHTNIN